MRLWSVILSNQNCMIVCVTIYECQLNGWNSSIECTLVRKRQIELWCATDSWALLVLYKYIFTHLLESINVWFNISFSILFSEYLVIYQENNPKRNCAIILKSISQLTDCTETERTRIKTMTFTYCFAFETEHTHLCTDITLRKMFFGRTVKNIMYLKCVNHFTHRVSVE